MPPSSRICGRRGPSSSARCNHRIRLFQFPAADPQPLGPGAHAGRLLGRVRRGDRLRHGAAGAGHPDGGQREPAGGLYRRRRLQALHPGDRRGRGGAAGALLRHGRRLRRLGPGCGALRGGLCGGPSRAARPGPGAAAHRAAGRPAGIGQDPPGTAARIAALAEALAAAGLAVRQATSPVPLEAMLETHRGVMLAELGRTHARLPRDLLSPRIAADIEAGLAISDADYQAGLRALAGFRRAFWAGFGAEDLLLLPAAPDVAPDAATTGDPSFVIPLTVLGGPSHAAGRAGCRHAGRRAAVGRAGRGCAAGRLPAVRSGHPARPVGWLASAVAAMSNHPILARREVWMDTAADIVVVDDEPDLRDAVGAYLTRRASPCAARRMRPSCAPRSRNGRPMRCARYRHAGRGWAVARPQPARPGDIGILMLTAAADVVDRVVGWRSAPTTRRQALDLRGSGAAAAMLRRRAAARGAAAPAAAPPRRPWPSGESASAATSSAWTAAGC